MCIINIKNVVDKSGSLALIKINIRSIDQHIILYLYNSKITAFVLGVSVEISKHIDRKYSSNRNLLNICCPGCGEYSICIVRVLAALTNREIALKKALKVF